VPLSFRHQRLVDCLIDAYIDWREECVILEDAYRRWVSAAASDAELAFAAYRAGLDREERASILYGELVSRVKKVLPHALRPGMALPAETLWA
jgi:hypothetical protein